MITVIVENITFREKDPELKELKKWLSLYPENGYNDELLIVHSENMNF